MYTYKYYFVIFSDYLKLANVYELCIKVPRT